MNLVDSSLDCCHKARTSWGQIHHLICVGFARCPCVCVGCFQVLQLPCTEYTQLVELG